MHAGMCQRPELGATQLFSRVNEPALFSFLFVEEMSYEAMREIFKQEAMQRVVNINISSIFRKEKQYF